MIKDHSDSEKGNQLRHIGYSYRLTARVLLYASSHRQDNTYHGLCYTSRGALAGTRNGHCSMQSPASPSEAMYTGIDSVICGDRTRAEVSLLITGRSKSTHHRQK